MSNNSERVMRWRRNHLKLCPICQSNLIQLRSKTCKHCSRFKGDKLLKDILNTGANTYQIIRWRARKSVEMELYKGCQICGYTNHVEVCHIRPVSSFNLDTPISVVNQRNNLVILCPNHHWELDNNLLKLNMD